MTNKETLEKAIEKIGGQLLLCLVNDDFISYAKNPDDVESIIETHIAKLIFSHDFAKALFGNKPMCSACERWHDAFCDCDYGIGNDMEEWQIRIRQMSIEPEPLKYIERFIT